MAVERNDPEFDLIVSGKDEHALADADPKIKSLFLHRCRAIAIVHLPRFSQLRKLKVADWMASDFEALRSLTELRELSIAHFPKANDLGPFESLQRVKTLTIESLPSWDGKKQLVVRSLTPLSKMGSLEHLEMFGLGVEDGRLDTVAGAKKLKKIRFNDNFSLQAMAKLAEARPDLNLSPTWSPKSKCKKCGGSELVLQGLRGTRQRSRCCSNCDAQRISDHLAEFERLKTVN